MAYKVIIMPPAKRRLDRYVCYTAEKLNNKQAARAILEDAKETKKRLSLVADSLKTIDNPLLAKHGYHKICFLKHKYLMIYRIQDSFVIVDGMFHESQDYESLFVNEMHLS
jgi:plasmid stabilization system protein ParE